MYAKKFMPAFVAGIACGGSLMNFWLSHKMNTISPPVTGSPRTMFLNKTGSKEIPVWWRNGRFWTVPDSIDQYVEKSSTPEPVILTELRNITKKNFGNDVMMLVGPSEGLLLKFLVQHIKAKRVLEIGTFTGYSAIFMAKGLPEDGELLTCDINSKSLEIAKEYVEKSGLSGKIKIYEKPGLELMEELKDKDIKVDLIFIDADKKQMHEYVALGLDLLTPCGIIVVDNTLFSGQVINPADPNINKDVKEAGQAIAEFNLKIVQDPQIEVIMSEMRDGISFIHKRQYPEPDAHSRPNIT